MTEENNGGSFIGKNIEGDQKIIDSYTQSQGSTDSDAVKSAFKNIEDNHKVFEAVRIEYIKEVKNAGKLLDPLFKGTDGWHPGSKTEGTSQFRKDINEGKAIEPSAIKAIAENDAKAMVESDKVLSTSTVPELIKKVLKVSDVEEDMMDLDLDAKFGELGLDWTKIFKDYKNNTSAIESATRENTVTLGKINDLLIGSIGKILGLHKIPNSNTSNSEKIFDDAFVSLKNTIKSKEEEGKKEKGKPISEQKTIEPNIIAKETKVNTEEHKTTIKSNLTNEELIKPISIGNLPEISPIQKEQKSSTPIEAAHTVSNIGIEKIQPIQGNTSSAETRSEEIQHSVAKPIEGSSSNEAYVPLSASNIRQKSLASLLGESFSTIGIDLESKDLGLAEHEKKMKGLEASSQKTVNEMPKHSNVPINISKDITGIADHSKNTGVVGATGTEGTTHIESTIEKNLPKIEKLSPQQTKTETPAQSQTKTETVESKEIKEEEKTEKIKGEPEKKPTESITEEKESEVPTKEDFRTLIRIMSEIRQILQSPLIVVPEGDKFS